jgi:hypothetical protein
LQSNNEDFLNILETRAGICRFLLPGRPLARPGERC